MMKKYLHKLIAAAVLVLLVGSPCMASNHGVGVTLLNYTLDTVDLGYTITINAQIRNFDSVPFAGTIDFGLRNDHYTLSTSSIFNKPPFSGNQISLYGHEIVPAIFSVHVVQGYFAPGPDVVVVWPICSQPIADSIVIGIYIENPNSIADNKEDPLSFIILNNRIFLKNYTPETNFKQVRLYNLLGQQVYEMHAEYITEVPLPVIPKGLYLCEFLAADGKRKVIRFFH